MSARPLFKAVATWLIASLCTLLVACGGGGGETTTNAQSKGSFSLSKNAINYSGYQSGTFEVSDTITMTITGADVAYAGAAYTASQPQVSWLGFDLTGSGKSYTLKVSIYPSMMNSGKSTAAFTIGTADSSGNVLATQVVNVAVDLIAPLSVSSNSWHHNGVFGGVNADNQIAVILNADSRTQWQASSSKSWITLASTSGQGNSTLNATIDIAALQRGANDAQITIQDRNNPGNSVNYSVSYWLDTPTSDAIAHDNILGGLSGLQNYGIPVDFSITTGEANHPFSLTFTTENGIDWLTADQTSGTVNGTTKRVYLTSHAPYSMAGSFNGTAHLAITVGDLVFKHDFNVKLNKEFNRMSLSSYAVALASAPDKSLLTREISVFSSLEKSDLVWTASSDQPWLSVTNSGTFSDKIVLTANPLSLASGVTHYANVTVSASDSGVENTESIRVGFTISNSVPETTIVDIPQTDSTYQDSVFHAANPLEPTALQGFGSYLALVNMVSAETIWSTSNTIANVGGMTYSVDGTEAFIVDNTNHQIVTIDPTSGAVKYRYQYGGESTDTRSLIHVRQNGKNILFGIPGVALDTDNYQAIPLAESGYGSVPAGASLNANYSPMLVVDQDGSVFDVKYSKIDGGSLRTGGVQSTGTTQGRTGQACFEPTKAMIYTASGAPYNFMGYNYDSRQLEKTLTADAYPNAIVCSNDGLIIGGIDGYYNSDDIYVYNASGFLKTMLNSSREVSGYRHLAHRGLTVSADGSQLIAVSERYSGPTQIKFMRLPSAN